MPTTRSPRSSSTLATWKPMNPAAPVRRIDMTLLAFRPEPAEVAVCPNVSPHRRQGLSCDDGVLEATAEVFEAKSQPRLLNDFPMNRLPPGCEALLQPVAPRHQIIHASTRAERIADGQ